MTFLVSGVLGTLYFCLDNDNLLFWSREKGGSSEPNELPLDPPLISVYFVAFGVPHILGGVHKQVLSRLTLQALT